MSAPPDLDALLTPISPDIEELAAMRDALARRTWEPEGVAVGTVGPAAPVAVLDVELDTTPAWVRPPRRPRRPFVLVAAALAVLLGLGLLVANRPGSTPRLGDPVLPAAMTDESVESAMPGLLEREARISWALVNWTQSPDLRQRMAEQERARIEADIVTTWTPRLHPEKRAYGEHAVQRGLLLRMPAYDQQRLDIGGMRIEALEDGRATVRVWYEYRLHVVPGSQDDPSSRFRAGTDVDGWTSGDPTNDRRFFLVLVDGSWLIDGSESLSFGV